MSKVVVFITNSVFFSRFEKTCSQLINNGNYSGDICLVIGDDLNENDLYNNDLIKKNKINIVKFPNINFPQQTIESLYSINTDGRNITKFFQWHKLYLFHPYFKIWDYVFYLDSGINIFHDINPILGCAKPNKLLAMSDAYPSYEWKLNCQFDKSKDLYTKLLQNYNLNIDYFQSTILLYDTNIIKENTFKDLYNLVIEYPITRTNEQAIMNLYFTCKLNIFEQISTENENYYYYAYLSIYKDKPYIMTKI